jgi:hypothetical protein
MASHEEGRSSRHPPTHPLVQLCGPDQRPTVRGRVVEVLTPAQYAVIEALLTAGPHGLSKDELDAASGHTEARKILKRLHDSYPIWASVIRLPRRQFRRYRLSW